MDPWNTERIHHLLSQALRKLPPRPTLSQEQLSYTLRVPIHDDSLRFLVEDTNYDFPNIGPFTLTTHVTAPFTLEICFAPIPPTTPQQTKP